MLLRVMGAPAKTEGEAVASVEGIMAAAARDGKKARIVSLDADEENGVWQAVLVFELEDPEIESVEPEDKPDHKYSPKKQDDFAVPALLYDHVLDQEGPEYEDSGSGPPSLRPVDEVHALPRHEPVHDLGFAAPGFSVENDFLRNDFAYAETANWKITPQECENNPELQQRIAHDLRLSEEYIALRRKIYLEELEGLQPLYTEAPEPEPD